MKLKHKFILLLCSLLISFVGAMPANAIICVSESGSIKLELGYNGACNCEEDSTEHDEHPSCEESDCTYVSVPVGDCSDMEIESFESDQRGSSIELASYKTLSIFDFSISQDSPSTLQSPSFWPLTKPSIPPPHLQILAISQILI